MTQSSPETLIKGGNFNIINRNSKPINGETNPERWLEIHSLNKKQSIPIRQQEYKFY